jgi:CRP-like cAMP-binding protein
MTSGKAAPHPILAGLTEEEQVAIGFFLKEVRYRAGESIWCEGQISEHALFILEGEVELLKETEFKGSRFVIGLFGAGTVIGEEAISSDSATRPESAVAVKDSLFLAFSHEDLRKLSARTPSAAIALLTHLLGLSSIRLSHAYRRMAAIF